MQSRYYTFAPFAAMMAVLISILGLTSCKDYWVDNSTSGPLKLSRSGDVTVGKIAEPVTIGVTSRGGSWSVTGATDWCTVAPDSGGEGTTEVLLTFTDNTGEGAAERTATLVFTSSGGATVDLAVRQLPTKIVPSNQNPDTGDNEQIFERIIRPWYLWSSEVQRTGADFNQPYDQFFARYLTNLKENIDGDGKTWGRTHDRYLYSFIKRHPTGSRAQNPLNYGTEFELTSEAGGFAVVGRVLYVERGSPAQRAGLQRGDYFFKVNATRTAGEMALADPMNLTEDPKYKERVQYRRQIDSLVRPIEGVSPHLSMLNYSSYATRPGESLTDNKRTVTLTPERFTGDPILYSNSFNTPSTGEVIRLDHLTSGAKTRTGYMVLNSFDEGLEQRLDEEFDRFKALSLTDFVLDLRYNKRGSIEVARKVASRLVPAAADGKTFARLEFNPGMAARNRTMTFSVNAARTLGLETIYILTSGNTAGAAEVLINALRGIPDDVKVIVVGDVTEGMNVGLVRQTLATAKWDYSAWIVAFRCVNALGEGDYRYGFTPNGGTVNEMAYTKWSVSWGWKGGTGRIEDPLLDKALEIVKGQVAIPTEPVRVATTRGKGGLPRDYCFPTTMTAGVE